MQFLVVVIKIDLEKLIQNNKEIIIVCDVMVVIGYKLRNGNFRDGIKESGLFCLNFEFGFVKEGQIVGMFGKFQLYNSNVLNKW